MPGEIFIKPVADPQAFPSEDVSAVCQEGQCQFFRNGMCQQVLRLAGMFVQRSQELSMLVNTRVDLTTALMTIEEGSIPLDNCENFTLCVEP